MKRIVLQEPGIFEFQHTNVNNTLKPGEALLKVHKIGICGTDLHAYAGEQPFFDYPRILGHEVGVEVVDIGENATNIQIGDKCSVEPYRATHPDDWAVKRGKPNCAEHLSVLGVHEDGGMREYFTFPVKYLHPSEELSYEQLALIEPMAIGCHAVSRAEITGDDTALVVGAGPIGLGAIQFARATDARVAVMEINEYRLNFCQNEVGIDRLVNPMKGETEAQIRSCFNGALPSIVLDATGSKQSMQRTFSYAAHGGKIIFIGLFQGDITFHDPDFHKKELTLLASRNALSSDFEQIILSIEKGIIDTSPWTTHRVHFDDMIEQFDNWTKPESNVIKAMVELDT
jgi:alcohol dehydrogenase